MYPSFARMFKGGPRPTTIASPYSIPTSRLLRPTLEVLARRAERTSGAQAEALAMRDEVEAMGEAFEKSLQEARMAGATGGDQIRKEAEESERQLREAARKDAAERDRVRNKLSSYYERANSAFMAENYDEAAKFAQLILVAGPGSEAAQELLETSRARRRSAACANSALLVSFRAHSSAAACRACRPSSAACSQTEAPILCMYMPDTLASMSRPRSMVSAKL